MAKKNTIAILMVLMAFASIITLAQETGKSNSAKPSENSKVDDALKRWTGYLKQHLPKESKLVHLDMLLAGVYRDRAELVYGGTGRRDVFYLIDDYIQIRTTADVDGKIETFPFAEMCKPWLKQPDGRLFYRPGE